MSVPDGFKAGAGQRSKSSTAFLALSAGRRGGITCPKIEHLFCRFRLERCDLTFGRGRRLPASRPDDPVGRAEPNAHEWVLGCVQIAHGVFHDVLVAPTIDGKPQASCPRHARLDLGALLHQSFWLRAPGRTARQEEEVIHGLWDPASTRGSPDSSIAGLSGREFEIPHQLGLGFGTRQFGEKLNCSIKTIEAHGAGLERKAAIEMGGAAR